MINKEWMDRFQSIHLPHLIRQFFPWVTALGAAEPPSRIDPSGEAV